MAPTHQLPVQAPVLNALQDTTPTKELHHAPNAQPNTPTARHATTPNASNAKQTTSYPMINRSVRKRIAPQRP